MKTNTEIALLVRKREELYEVTQLVRNTAFLLERSLKSLGLSEYSTLQDSLSKIEGALLKKDELLKEELRSLTFTWDQRK